MYTFYTWPGADPRKCHVCRKRLKRSFLFGDTTQGLRNVVMCEDCFRKVGASHAMYGEPRRYVRIKGLWVSGSLADWRPEDIPDGTACVLVNNMTGEEVKFVFDKSQVGK